MLTEKDKRKIAEAMNHDAEEQRNERDYPPNPFAEIVNKVAAAQNQLTQQQLLDAFKQAIISGDFLRQVRIGDHAQTVIYMPGEGMERAKIAAVESFKRQAWQLCGELLNELAVYDARFFERHGGPAARAFLKPNDENQNL